MDFFVELLKLLPPGIGGFAAAVTIGVILSKWARARFKIVVGKDHDAFLEYKKSRSNGKTYVTEEYLRDNCRTVHGETMEQFKELFRTTDRIVDKMDDLVERVAHIEGKLDR